MLNIVIPMAGDGRRFAEAGFAMPKPLVPVHGMPMIELVVRNLAPRQPHRIVFICKQNHLREHGLAAVLAGIAPGSVVRSLAETSQGAACTVLQAADLIDSADPLLIANCDQFVACDMSAFVERLARYDGLIMTMRAQDPKWSFAACGPQGLVTRVAEKEVISDTATVGVYGFTRGNAFCAAARRMIAAERRVRGEFYLAPVYNEMIAAGARVGTWSVGSVGAGMDGLGTPEDLARFLADPRSAPRVEALRPAPVG